ncbi:uncharacterized protein VTP21DRAFT_11292 [Calcarisporiella thermophila]|uniref:uncharacterized protein n=1 Tax=Calcarisporiella thermophila TaxID=911321 RepID=UPI0037447727
MSLHHYSLTAATDRAFTAIKEHALQTAWQPLCNLARYGVLNLMARARVGRLRVESPNGTWEFGDGNAKEHIELKVIREVFWLRLALFSDMGFAEAYMSGDVECSDLVGLIDWFILNRDHLNGMNNLYSSVYQAFQYLANSRFANTLSNTMGNISAHYDISNDMFASFLDETMTYSSAYWLTPQDTLEEGQKQKLRKVIELARLTATDHVLEIGTGWGSFAIEAVKSTGCRVTTVTLSKEQKQLAEERIAAAGLASQIKVLLCDYREIPASHQYDKIVSIEMIEAVGQRFLPTYFEQCHRLLKRQGGILVMQAITMPEARYKSYCREVDFIRKYIFPGGHAPTVTALLNAAYEGTQGGLQPDQVLNFGPHYARTLRLWREQFLSAFGKRIGPALQERYPDIGAPELEVFRRKWEYYFAYCEGGYRAGTLGVHWLVFKRESDAQFVQGVPL